MRIGVLETGPVSGSLAARHGTYFDMFRAMFAEAAPDFEFERFVVHQGIFPSGPEAEDGWIITGSRHGAYEDHDWILPLESLIREIVASRRPLLGVCFGHQIMAQALGGKVIKSPKGWGLGTTRYTLAEARPDYMDADEFTALAVHQDQVVEVPEGAWVIARTEFCPVAALAYGDVRRPHALSVQPHPEFRTGFVSDLIDERLANVVGEGLAAEAKASLARPNDNAAWAHWAARFFREGGHPEG